MGAHQFLAASGKGTNPREAMMLLPEGDKMVWSRIFNSPPVRATTSMTLVISS